jgi:hypothetical protein
MHYIFLGSLLMFKVDEALALEASVVIGQVGGAVVPEPEKEG